MISSKNKEDHWVCSCGNSLSNKIDKSSVVFRGINGQKTDVEYFLLSAICSKCGLEHSKTGVLFDDMEKLKQLLEGQQEGDNKMLKIINTAAAKRGIKFDE